MSASTTAPRTPPFTPADRATLATWAASGAGRHGLGVAVMGDHEAFAETAELFRDDASLPLAFLHPDRAGRYVVAVGEREQTVASLRDALLAAEFDLMGTAGAAHH